MKKAYLALADGTVFEGVSLGATGTTIGEIVFTTGMTGYLEAITDPSFSGQIVAMTYPIIGNYGVNREDCQSSCAQVKGVIMKEAATHPNNFRSKETIEEYLVSENVIAITGIDTRALTKIIRTNGAMNAMITTDEDFNFANYEAEIKAYKVPSGVEHVTCKETYSVGNGDLKVALMNYGLKRTLLESLTKRGLCVTVYPSNTPAETVLAEKPDGIVLSGGPGDPAACQNEISEIRKLMDSKTPVLGVGLGHQLAALAMGAKTEKMKFGHRGASQPVKDLSSGQTFVTLQNHGYAVVLDSLKEDIATVTHININDGSVEGIRYKEIPALSVQYDPECKPGAKSVPYLLEEFVAMMGGKNNA